MNVKSTNTAILVDAGNLFNKLAYGMSEISLVISKKEFLGPLSFTKQSQDYLNFHSLFITIIVAGKLQEKQDFLA